MLTFAAVIYCLSLLIGMKLALVGRLGGLADSSRAFFMSLIVMVLILPWQQALSTDIYGLQFGYKELISRYQAVHEASKLGDYFIYYGRFVGLWLLTMLLLMIAQICSNRAKKSISRHLKQLKNIQSPTLEGVEQIINNEVNQ